MAANLFEAALSGLSGAVIMTVLIYLFKAWGLSLDIPYLLGTRFVSTGNRTKAYLTGMTLHLLSGAVWGIVYVFFLTAMAITPNWPAGILYGFAHGIFIGVMIGILAQSHPLIGEGRPMEDPGMFGSRWGTGIPYVLLATHIVYGVSTLYIYHNLFRM